jgi:hypothetical protein
MTTQSKTGSSGGAQGAVATATSEIVSQIARNAAGELVKGQQPVSDVARKVAAEAVETLDKRGPELAKQAGIMTWRYAALGWVTWNVGKRVLRHKVKGAASRPIRKGGTANGAASNQGQRRKQG